MAISAGEQPGGHRGDGAAQHKGPEGAGREPWLQVAQRRRNVKMVLEGSWSCAPESSPAHCTSSLSLHPPPGTEGEVIHFSQSFNCFSLIPGSPAGNSVLLNFVLFGIMDWNHFYLTWETSFTLGKELPIKHEQMFVLLYVDLFVGAFVINCINAIWISNN